MPQSIVSAASATRTNNAPLLAELQRLLQAMADGEDDIGNSSTVVGLNFNAAECAYVLQHIYHHHCNPKILNITHGDQAIDLVIDTSPGPHLTALSEVLNGPNAQSVVDEAVAAFSRQKGTTERA